MPNTTSTSSSDPKDILKQMLHEWWYVQGGETKYGTLKNFSEELDMPNETFAGIWRGRGFPSKANLQKLASRIPLAEIAKKLGFPAFSQENGTSGEEDDCSIKDLRPKRTVLNNNSFFWRCQEKQKIRWIEILADFFLPLFDFCDQGLENVRMFSG